MPLLVVGDQPHRANHTVEWPFADRGVIHADLLLARHGHDELTRRGFHGFLAFFRRLPGEHFGMVVSFRAHRRFADPALPLFDRDEVHTANGALAIRVL